MYGHGANLLLCFLLLGAIACKADTRVTEKSLGAACPLLSAADIQAVQGEAVAVFFCGEAVSKNARQIFR